MKNISRRDFLRLSSLGLTTLALQQLLAACSPKPQEIPEKPTQIPLAPTSTIKEVPTSTPLPERTDLVVSRGTDPEQIVRQGITALGGIERFLKPGYDVIIKPNICAFYNTYEYASTTNPWVVGALVKICLEAGAKRVRVMDFPFGGTAEQAYLKSGIQDQVQAAGGIMETMIPLKYETITIPNALHLNKVSVYPDVLDADLLINVPIAKTHGMAGLTLGLKNLMGTIQRRELIHAWFETALVDLATLVKPQLTVIDAIRTLMANGPTGGNLSDVKLQSTVILSPDIVAADSYATSLFGMKPQDIPYIINAGERGLGHSDLSSVNILEVNSNA